MLHDPDNPLAAELLQETAETYFAACKKMVKALEALKAFDCGAVSSSPGKGQIERRSALLEEAAELVHFVVIQREAMKLTGYEKFFADYEIPDEVRRRLGTRRRK